MRYNLEQIFLYFKNEHVKNIFYLEIEKELTKNEYPLLSALTFHNYPRHEEWIDGINELLIKTNRSSNKCTIDIVEQLMKNYNLTNNLSHLLLSFYGYIVGIQYLSLAYLHEVPFILQNKNNLKLHLS